MDRLVSPLLQPPPTRPIAGREYAVLQAGGGKDPVSIFDPPPAVVHGPDRQARGQVKGNAKMMLAGPVEGIANQRPMPLLVEDKRPFNRDTRARSPVSIQPEPNRIHDPARGPAADGGRYVILEPERLARDKPVLLPAVDLRGAVGAGASEPVPEFRRFRIDERAGVAHEARPVEAKLDGQAIVVAVPAAAEKSHRSRVGERAGPVPP